MNNIQNDGNISCLLAHKSRNEESCIFYKTSHFLADRLYLCVEKIWIYVLRFCLKIANIFNIRLRGPSHSIHFSGLCNQYWQKSKYLKISWQFVFHIQCWIDGGNAKSMYVILFISRAIYNNSQFIKMNFSLKFKLFMNGSFHDCKKKQFLIL